MTNGHETREGWLRNGASLLVDRYFKPRGIEMPSRILCACGFPRGKKSVIGQCWHQEAHEDGSVSIFISPAIAEPVRALDVLLHELIHAHLGFGIAHKAPFARMAREMGLEGKPTATVAGEKLSGELGLICEELGPYPHSRINEGMQMKIGRGGRTESVKLVSINEPKYTFRLSGIQFEEHGAPTDPWGDQMVIAE